MTQKRKTPHRGHPVQGGEVLYINFRKADYTPSAYVKAPVKLPFKHCRGCGAPFRPYRSSHVVCRVCYQWNRALNGIVEAGCALKENREDSVHDN
jgi:hypothetical protein